MNCWKKAVGWITCLVHRHIVECWLLGVTWPCWSRHVGCLVVQKLRVLTLLPPSLPRSFSSLRALACRIETHNLLVLELSSMTCVDHIFRIKYRIFLELRHHIHIFLCKWRMTLLFSAFLWTEELTAFIHVDSKKVPPKNIQVINENMHYQI